MAVPKADKKRGSNTFTCRASIREALKRIAHGFITCPDVDALGAELKVHEAVAEASMHAYSVMQLSSCRRVLTRRDRYVAFYYRLRSQESDQRYRSIRVSDCATAELR